MAFESDVTGREYSQRDFLELLEKRIRKHLRLEGGLDLDGKYAIVSREDVASEVLKYFLETIFSRRLQVRCIDEHSELQEQETELSASYLEEYIGNSFFQQ